MTENFKRDISKETSSIKYILLIALPSLILAEIAQTTDLVLFVFGVVLCTVFIYTNTLKKSRTFDYIMVMYMLCLFPAQATLGGTFPLVAALILFIQLFSSLKYGEYNSKDLFFTILLGIWFVSSVLGWLFVNQSDMRSFILGILAFIGILSLLYMSGRIIVTPTRIVKFIKLNVFLAIYALIASLNTMVKIIPEMVFLPQWAGEWIDTENIFNAGAGGIVGVSPLNGQHNLLIAVLFFSFYFYSLSYKGLNIKKNVLITGIIFAIINVFTAGSKAVFATLIFLIILVYFFQGRLYSKVNFGKRIYQVFTLVFISLSLLFAVFVTGFDNVFNRYQDQIERNEMNTGEAFSIEGVLDGTVLNRSNAFEAAFSNFNRRNWIIGYGWSTPKNQIDAFYGNSVYRTIRGGSAHSQYFSTLFLFGWIGFLAFWMLHIRLIIKSYRFSAQIRYPIENRIFAIACMGIVFALMIHGVTADNTWFAGYFTSTLIIIGLGYSNFNSARYMG